MQEFNSTYRQIVEALGKPVSEKADGEVRVLLYGSSSMTLADLYYFQNDRLVVQSVSFYKQPKPMEIYVLDLGKPAYSVRKYRSGSPDSLTTVVHVWPEKGRAVTTTGTAQASVIREDQFAPTTLAKYLETWGKDLADNQQVAYTGQATTQTPFSGAPSRPSYVLGGVTLGIVILIAVVVWWRKKKAV